MRDESCHKLTLATKSLFFLHTCHWIRCNRADLFGQILFNNTYLLCCSPTNLWHLLTFWPIETRAWCRLYGGIGWLVAKSQSAVTHPRDRAFPHCWIEHAARWAESDTQGRNHVAACWNIMGNCTSAPVPSSLDMLEWMHHNVLCIICVQYLWFNSGHCSGRCYYFSKLGPPKGHKGVQGGQWKLLKKSCT